MIFVLFVMMLLTVIPVHAATRLGLHTTAEEKTIWLNRSTSGPYKTLSDVSTNSPGDWTRILGNANSFLSNPSQDRWAGQTTASCWSPNTLPEPAKPASRDDGERMRDAGFVFLVTGGTNYRDAVLNELLAQAATAGTQWVSPRWCTSPAISAGHSWEIAMWLTKLVHAYDYIRSSISVSNRNTLDAWFLAGGTYWEAISQEGPKERFPNRTSGDYTTLGFGWSTSNLTNTHCAYGPCITHFGGHTKVNFHEAWNNRAAQQLRVGFLVGIMLDNTTLINAGKRWVQEWLRFAVFSDNTSAEMHRWEAGSPGEPCLGWWYTGFQLGTMITIADVLARYNGDTSLFDMVTSEGFGLQTPAGGPKSLLGVMTLYARFVDGTITRYGTNVSGNNGNVNYRIRASCPSYGFNGVTDTFMARANVYYKNSYIASVYKRQAAGSPAYVQNPFTGGYGAWAGEWGVYPAALFMSAGMEGLVNPYGEEAPTEPDITSNLELRIPFEEGSSNIANDTSGNNRHATLNGSFSWQPGVIGNKSIQFNGNGAGGQVTGLLGSPSSITLSAHVQILANNVNGGTGISLGDHIAFRVYENQVRAFFWNGSTWAALNYFFTYGSGFRHVVYVHDGSSHSIYVDGVLGASVGATPIVWSGLGSNTRVGRHGDLSTQFDLNGKIDEVRVYSRALNATDITALRTAGTTGLSIALVSPVSGGVYETTSSSIGFSGTSVDTNGSVSSVTYTCTNGCSPKPAVVGTTNWNVTGVGLQLGTSVFTFTATDNQGNTAVQSLTVVRTDPVVPPPASGCDYYASNTGGGTRSGLNTNNPFQIINFWPVATPGKTLCLMDGVYTGGNSMIHVPTTFAGTSSQPIRIKAINDGKVEINGGTTRPIDLNGAWGILEGINSDGADNQAIVFRGTDWIARRVISWNNGTQDAGILSMAGFRNTIEDCALFGQARIIATVGAANPVPTFNVMRRCWGRWEQRVGSGSPHVTFVAGYAGQSNVLFENNIVTRNRVAGNAGDTEPPMYTLATQNTRFLGNISYVKQGAVFDTTLLFRQVVAHGSFPSAPRSKNNTFKDLVAVAEASYSNFGNMRGYDLTGDPGEMNTASNLVALSGQLGSCATSSWNGCNTIHHGTTMAAVLNTYPNPKPTNIYQAVPGICKRYVNGVLTNDPLWPWPMNQRIKDALVRSGRAEVDVTDTIETLLGTIPTECKTTAVITPPPVLVATSLDFIGSSVLNTKVCPVKLNSFQVRVLDQNGAVFTGNEVPVTVGFESNPGLGELQGVTSVTTVNGVATFDDLCVTEAGNGYDLRFSSGVLNQDVSNEFNITEDPVPFLHSFQVEPVRSTKDGSVLSPGLEVKVVDQTGNVVMGNTSEVTLSLANAPAGVSLSGTLVKTAVNGVVVFDDVVVNGRGDGIVLKVESADVVTQTSAPFRSLFRQGIVPKNKHSMGLVVGNRR